METENEIEKFELKKIQIQNFKSIEYIALEDIPPLIVLVGPNGSGKSNFVDALKFIGLLNKYGLNTLQDENYEFFPDKIKNRNLIDDIKETIFFSFSLLDSQSKKRNCDYEIYLPHSGNFSFNRVNEAIEIQDFDHMSIVTTNEEETIRIMRSNDYSEEDKHELIQDKLKYKIYKPGSFIGNTEIFRIDPFEIKNRRNNNPDSLNESGSNIAAVLEKLEKDDLLREEILDWLTLIVPELETIKTHSNHLDGSKGLVFQEKSGQQFPAHMISDGTIYALCILVAVLTRTQKPGITIIEEPERGLHPQAIHELIGFIRAKARPDHPIILTSHSESVVRALELDELYLVHKENGATQIRSAKASGVDKREIPLDTAWLTNLFDGGLPW